MTVNLHLYLWHIQAMLIVVNRTLTYKWPFLKWIFLLKNKKIKLIETTVSEKGIKLADAKSTPAYSWDLHILCIIMQLLDLWWQYHHNHVYRGQYVKKTMAGPTLKNFFIQVDLLCDEMGSNSRIETQLSVKK